MRFIFVLISLIMVSNFTLAQNSKVKFKKGIVSVDDKQFCEYENIGDINKVSYKLNGKEFMYLRYEGVLTGKYDSNGKEIERRYVVIHFTSTDIKPFESSLTRKTIIRQLISNKVVENGKFNPEQAKLFAQKFSENISEKYKKTTIEININD